MTWGSAPKYLQQQAEPPRGFRPIGKDKFFSADLLVMDAQDFAEIPTQDDFAKPRFGTWLELRYLDATQGLGFVFPNDASTEFWLMLYRYTKDDDGVGVLRPVASQLRFPERDLVGLFESVSPCAYSPELRRCVGHCQLPGAECGGRRSRGVGGQCVKCHCSS